MFLTRWLKPRTHLRTIERPCFRPKVESLETREVPAILTVTTTDDLIADDGLLSLREAVIQANATNGVDTIVVPAGTYALRLNGCGEDLAATGDLDLTDSASIEGAGAGNTVIDGGSLDRIIHIVGAGRVNLSGLTIQDGPAGYGGAIYNQTGANLTVDDCIITGSETDYAGGIAQDGGALRMVNSRIADNYAYRDGGGLLVSGFGASVDLRNCVVTGNGAYHAGGGIEQFGGDLTLTRCTISNNAANEGGGVLHANGTLTIQDSTLANNVAFNFAGGGIFSYSKLVVSRSSFVGNSGGGQGGAVFSYGEVNITNSELVGNSAYLGGGIFNYGTTDLKGSNLRGNSANGGGAVYSIAGGPLSVTGCTFTGNTASDHAGAIYNATTMTIRNSTFTENSAAYYAGAIANDGDATITASTIIGNSAMWLSNISVRVWSDSGVPSLL